MKKIGLAAMALAAMLAVAGCSADSAGSDSTGESSTAASTTESSAAKADVTIADGTSDEAAPAEGTVYMRQLYAAPHGTKSFAAINVTMNGDKILAARIDEFQYVSPDGFKGVPNSDATFGESYPKDNILVGKEENNDAYSKLMADNGGATQTWKESMTAITDFAVGKTADELKDTIKELAGLSEDDSPADVVTGSTFSDTSGYLQAIVDTAEHGMLTTGIETDATDFKEAQALSAPHGDRAFAITTVAMDGDKLAAVFVDEFQYVDPASFGGVPNSDDEFGADVQDGQVLASKEANDEAYSKLMADNGGATQGWKDSMKAISAFAVGKTVDELEAAIGDLSGLGEDDSVTDVITGATFEDAGNYLQSIVDAMKAAE